MGKKMLILVPTLRLGGAERTAVNTANIMRKSWEIHFSVFDGSEAVYSPECPVDNLNLPVRVGKIAKFLQVLRRCRNVKRIKNKEKIEACISFGPTANLVNVLSGGSGKRITNLRGYASASGSFLYKYQYRRSDMILCCSREIKRRIDSQFPNLADKTFVLYNPYDLETIWEKGKEAVEDVDFSRRTIVTHGRLNAIKNHYRLIKAFSLVRQEHADVQLLIVGEGEMREELRQLIDAFGLHDDVKLIGFRCNPYQYLARSTLYVLSSFSEGFPNALVEGMCFLPVVSVDCPSGPCEILRNDSDLTHIKGVEDADYGVLVGPATSRTMTKEVTEDDRLLAQAINSLLCDEGRLAEFRRKAQQRASEFSIERYERKLTELLEKN